MTATRKLKTFPSGVTVHFNTEWEEYEVHVKGNPAATYFTDDREDAMQSAAVMSVEVTA